MNKGTQQTFIRVAKGSISVLLCLVITPFLTIAASLVEMHRYQTATTAVQELIDLCSFSTLADYDPYLLDRFGLLALSQDSNPNDVYQELMNYNLNMMGQGVTPGLLSATPSNPLSGFGSESQYDVIRKQITDFGEMTVMSEFAFSELKLDELMDKLNALMGLSEISEATGAIATLASAVETLVTDVNTLIATLDSINTNIATVDSSYASLQSNMLAMIKQISDDNFVLAEDDPATTDINERDVSYDDFVYAYGYYLDINSNYTNTLSVSINVITADLGQLPIQINKVSESLEGAQKALKEAKEKTVGSEKADDSTKKAADPMEVLVNAIDDAIEKAVEKFADNTFDDILASFGTFMSNLDIRFKSGSQSIFISDPTTGLLSQKAKDLIDIFLEISPATWTEEGIPQIRQSINTRIFAGDLEVGLINDIITEISEDLIGSVDDAEDGLTTALTESFTELLSGLIKSIENLFNLDGFYNPDLNAFLSDEVMAMTGAVDNPFQKILEAVKGIFDAAEDLKNALSGNFLALISAVKTLFDSVTLAIDGLVNLVKDKIEKIQQVLGYFTGANPSTFYDLMLMSSYMTYNLPNRTSNRASDSALTGYKFSEISVPEAAEGYIPGDALQGMEALIGIINDLANGGSDDMFKGAELEYIIAGTQSELVNQAITFMDIYFLRLIINLPSVFLDGNVNAMAATFNIASWVIYILVILGEPLVDTLLIVNGISVPLVKRSCYLTPVGIPQLLKDAGTGSPIAKKLSESTAGTFEIVEGSGFEDFKSVNDLLKINYRTYCLLIITFTVKEEDIMQRFLDIVQLEAAKHYAENGADFAFDINHTYTTLQTSSTFTFNSMFNFIDVADTGIFTRTITRERGY